MLLPKYINMSTNLMNEFKLKNYKQKKSGKSHNKRIVKSWINDKYESGKDIQSKVKTWKNINIPKIDKNW